MLLLFSISCVFSFLFLLLLSSILIFFYMITDLDLIVQDKKEVSRSLSNIQ